jgi:nucleoside-diphosphate-sugar epimerase
MAATLWIGGTSALARYSCLAYFVVVVVVLVVLVQVKGEKRKPNVATRRTYIEELPDKRHVILAAPEYPTWLLPAHTSFVKLDLLSRASMSTLMARALEVSALKVDTLVFGVRAPLVFGSQTRHLDLFANVRSLIEHAHAAGVQSVLHVSSVAVMDHLVLQANVNESHPLPHPSHYVGKGGGKGSYDFFKRMCEDLISEVCEEKGMEYCHMRISGIFSNPGCIQMSTMKLQAYVGFNIQTAIDFVSPPQYPKPL